MSDNISEVDKLLSSLTNFNKEEDTEEKVEGLDITKEIEEVRAETESSEELTEFEEDIESVINHSNEDTSQSSDEENLVEDDNLEAPFMETNQLETDSEPSEPYYVSELEAELDEAERESLEEDNEFSLEDGLDEDENYFDNQNELDEDSDYSLGDSDDEEEEYYEDEDESGYDEIVIMVDDETGEETELTHLGDGKYQDNEGNTVYLNEDGEAIVELPENYEEIKAVQTEFKEKLRASATVVDIEFELRSNDGGTVPTRQQGELTIELLDIDEIKVTHRSRMEGKDNFNLQESLTRFGQLTPIHVVEFGDYYILLDGFRRLESLKAIGKSEVLAIIDSTIPPELVKYYEAIVNNVLVYNFQEQITYAKFVQSKQPQLDVSVIEGILGLGHGELYKALYVDSLKTDFPEAYQQLDAGKITIDQAFKKIEKEIAKIEKGQDGDNMDALNSGELDNQLRNVDELANMENAPDQQDVNNRKILDPVLRRSVESRDGGFCQCCEFGKGEPDFMGVFNVHHMVAVMYGGSDSQSNLILLCSNCHTLVHDYERGRFHPEEETIEKYPHVKKILILGNMLAIMKKKALHILRTKHENTARLVDRNKMGLGKAILKHGLALDGEQYFNGSPYQTFVEASENIDKGMEVAEGLGDINYEVEEE